MFHRHKNKLITNEYGLDTIHQMNNGTFKWYQYVSLFNLWDFLRYLLFYLHKWLICLTSCVTDIISVTQEVPIIKFKVKYFVYIYSSQFMVKYRSVNSRKPSTIQTIYQHAVSSISVPVCGPGLGFYYSCSSGWNRWWTMR